MPPREFETLFHSLYGRFTNLAELSNKSRPLHLAHYTSVTALEKIVERNEIWFSNPLFMNDHEEMRFGIFEAKRILQEASAGSTLTDLVGGVENFNRITKIYDELFRQFDENVAFDVYVFCLSEYDRETHPDLMNPLIFERFEFRRFLSVRPENKRTERACWHSPDSSTKVTIQNSYPVRLV